MSEAEIHAWMQNRIEWSTPPDQPIDNVKWLGDPVITLPEEEIDRPSRYGGDTCMKAIADASTPEELRGFIKMTIMRYLWREQHKGGDRDLRKAQWYLNWYLQHIGGESNG